MRAAYRRDCCGDFAEVGRCIRQRQPKEAIGAEREIASTVVDAVGRTLRAQKCGREGAAARREGLEREFGAVLRHGFSPNCRATPYNPL